MKKDFIIIGIITLFVLLGVVYGFTVVGLPQNSRAIRLDSIRRNDLSNIKSRIENYYSTNNKLPNNVQEAVMDAAYVKILDPQTNKPYEYFIIDIDSYKLCATFGTKYPLNDSVSRTNYNYPANFYHNKGYNCFDFEVKSNQYNYNYPTSRPTVTITSAFKSPTVPAISAYADQNILSVKLDTYAYPDQSSKFPEGFFTNNDNEFGFVNYRPNPIPINTYITFVKPVKLVSLTNSFAACSKGECYKWTATGTTINGENISLTENMIISDNNLQPRLNITSDELFTNITISVFNIYDKSNYIKWKKMKFTYK